MKFKITTAILAALIVSSSALAEESIDYDKFDHPVPPPIPYNTNPPVAPRADMFRQYVPEVQRREFLPNSPIVPPAQILPPPVQAPQAVRFDDVTPPLPQARIVPPPHRFDQTWKVLPRAPEAPRAQEFRPE